MSVKYQTLILQVVILNYMNLFLCLKKYKADEIRAMNQKVKSDYNTNSKILDGQIKEKERDIQIKSDIDTAELVLQKKCITGTA